MVVPDINVLVFIYNEAAPRHDAARAWWEALMMGRERFGVPRAASSGLSVWPHTISQNGAGIDIIASRTTVESSVLRLNDGDCLVVDDGPAAQDRNTVRLNRCEYNHGRGVVVSGVMNTVAGRWQSGSARAP